MHTQFLSARRILAVILVALAVPCPAAATPSPHEPTATEIRMAEGQPFEQDLVITAYYSPEPRQCSYVMGDLAADKAMNGQGIAGADGTPVYPGMAAAPRAYPFGTRLVIPGVGTVTVHDRGGAIVEETAAHRLDLWVGAGEEGLARALAFGVVRVRGVVYPAGSPQPEESMDLLTLPAPVAVLRHYLAENAKLQDCDAMLNFGTSLGKTVGSYSVTHRSFAFIHAPPASENMTFFASQRDI